MIFLNLWTILLMSLLSRLLLSTIFKSLTKMYFDMKFFCSILHKIPSAFLICSLCFLTSEFLGITSLNFQCHFLQCWDSDDMTIRSWTIAPHYASGFVYACVLLKIVGKHSTATKVLPFHSFAFYFKTVKGMVTISLKNVFISAMLVTVSLFLFNDPILKLNVSVS